MENRVTYWSRNQYSHSIALKRNRKLWLNLKNYHNERCVIKPYCTLGSHC